MNDRLRLDPGFVKICSLREAAHAALVVAAGADAFGLIFAEARRRVTVEQAAEIVAQVRRLAPAAPPNAVGVFVDPTADHVNAVARTVGLALAQLHGEEPPELLAQVDVPVLKVIRPVPGASLASIEREMARYVAAERPPVAFVLDGYHPHHRGGVGVRADWALAAELAARWPVILAGGLTPENVGDAVRTVRPLGVDVSSGVETDGAKDGAKIAAFVANAREAFAGRENEERRCRFGRGARRRPKLKPSG